MISNIRTGIEILAVVAAVALAVGICAADDSAAFSIDDMVAADGGDLFGAADACDAEVEIDYDVAAVIDDIDVAEDAETVEVASEDLCESYVLTVAPELVYVEPAAVVELPLENAAAPAYDFEDSADVLPATEAVAEVASESQSFDMTLVIAALGLLALIGAAGLVISRH